MQMKMGFKRFNYSILAAAGLLLLNSGTVRAQLNLSMFQSNNQQLVEEAVQRGLMLVKQEYVVQDTVTGQKYGLNDQDDFGSWVSFCVLVKDGYVTSQRLIEPWKQDVQFQRRAGSLVPLRSSTSFRTVQDTQWQQASLLDPAEIFAMEDAGWVSVKDSCFAGEGFLLAESAGKREGWLVWLASDKADRDEWDAARLSLVSYRYQIDLSSENPMVESPKTDKSVIGGIYVEPVFDPIGVVRFELGGVLVKEGAAWQLLGVPEEYSQAVEETGALTPLTVSESDGASDANGDATDNQDNGKGKKRRK